MCIIIDDFMKNKTHSNHRIDKDYKKKELITQLNNCILLYNEK